VLVAVAKNGQVNLGSAKLALRHASTELQGDREVVLAAVAKNGGALEYASVELKGDREVVLAAVAKAGNALEYASAELQADREVVLVAVAEEGRALKYASAELKGDREVVLVAVKKNGHAEWLQHASAELQGDQEVVLHAVAQNGHALQYASAELRGDREVVLVAVAQNGWALRHASEELQGDREVVLVAVAQNSEALQLASAELQAANLAGGTVTVAAAAPAAAADSAADSALPPAKKAKHATRTYDARTEARLAAMMTATGNVESPALHTLETSSFKACYDRCKPPRWGEGMWTDPVGAVEESLPQAFHRKEWQKALWETQGPSALAHAGAACAMLWSTGPMNRLVQQVRAICKQIAIKPLFGCHR
jgi:hypothetical protein